MLTLLCQVRLMMQDAFTLKNLIKNKTASARGAENWLAKFGSKAVPDKQA